MDVIPIFSRNHVDKPEQEQVQEQQTEYQMVGSYMRRRSLTLYAYHTLTGDVTEVDVLRSTTIHVEPIGGVLRAVDKEMGRCLVDPRNIYFESLNYANALRRVRRYKNGDIPNLCNLKPYKEGCIRPY